MIIRFALPRVFCVGLSLTLCACAAESPQQPAPAPAPAPVPSRAAVAIAAQPGAVQGKPGNSDAFIWDLVTQFAAPASPQSPSPVVFETWASDEDTFNQDPQWPSGPRPLRFHVSVLETIKKGEPVAPAKAFTIDVACNPPTGAAVGHFPTTGTPPPCVAEQVARNRPLFDYIVKNSLNTRTGLAAAYKSGITVDMPVEAIALKGDWVPVAALLQWVPQIGDLNRLRTLYYTTTSNAVEYGLVSMHIASRQNPDWVWGTIEHELNPGRCDYIGCYDTFGAQVPAVQPNRTAVNAGYGVCAKTPQLKAMMEQAKLSPVWEHYCMKSTMVDYAAADGTPYALGNSVIEGIVGNGTVAASSCISCHAYASFGATGAPTAAATAILPFNPTGKPIQDVLNGSKTFSFNWGVLLAPK